MGKLKCILCAPWNCCGSSQAIQTIEVQEHRRTQISGLDQAIRSINLGQNNYTRQIDDPNHEITFSSKIKPDHISQASQPSILQMTNDDSY